MSAVPERFDAAPVLAGLKDFQRATVAHVDHRFFESSDTRRFLVADETGLGKSVVARGVIARAIERLQDDPTVRRIDIIYVCSNQDIAAQNLRRLDVTGGRSQVSSTRLSLLARQMHLISGEATAGGKTVNLVAFTPGTSFASSGWRTGTVDERALIWTMLAEPLQLDGWGRRALTTILTATAHRKNFEPRIRYFEWERSEGRIDQTIAGMFLKLISGNGLRRRTLGLIERVGRRMSLDRDLKDEANALIGDLRHALARAGVERLEPDLVIFDEFQRFRHLLADPTAEEISPAAELASDLFDFEAAKLLLLSATPYKPYTMVEEAALDDDHYADFRRTLTFLRADPEWNASVTTALAGYRRAAFSGDAEDARREREALQGLLLQVMARTERPTLGENGMLAERHTVVRDLVPSDVSGYVSLRQFAKQVEGQASLDYWKSAPYFLNFCDGYQIHHRITSRTKAGLEIDPDGCQLIPASVVDEYGALDLGNARLRELGRQTLDQDWWRLLWMPPSMPYHELGPRFAAAAAAGATKRLVFSSWNATPAATAALLSYEAERRTFGPAGLANTSRARDARTGRLRILFGEDRPVSLTNVSMFWPQPTLAEAADPLTIARSSRARLSAHELHEQARRRILALAESGQPSDPGENELDLAELALRWPAPTPEEPITGAADGEDASDGSGWQQSLEWARTLERRLPDTQSVQRHIDDLALLALHAPGNVAWRALGRVIGESVSNGGRWAATLVVADGLRTLFNRPETAVLLDLEFGAETPTWLAALRYAESGALQSVLDEYVHHVRSELPDGDLDDAGLLAIARQIREALTLRTSSPNAFNPADPTSPISLRTRFALRYGSVHAKQDSARPTEVRTAFNSPFWPFVLATTSAGQEGIDFHWWCSAVVHWNTPANPVDFEQREGRVNRFGGHAVRRNVAAAHWDDTLGADDADPWKSAYDAAARASHGLGEFAPHWVYPGESKVERHVFTYPLSKDATAYAQLKADLATYRLAFGQPRQEDLLEVLSRRGEDSAGWEPLNLRPSIVGSQSGLHRPQTHADEDGTVSTLMA